VKSFYGIGVDVRYSFTEKWLNVPRMPFLANHLESFAEMLFQLMVEE
jgi:hypothetical protein